MELLKEPDQGPHIPHPPSRLVMLIIAGVFAAAVLFGGGLLAYWVNVRPTIKAPDRQLHQNQAIPAELMCEDDWQAYERESIKIGFCYPQAWGGATLSDAKLAPADTGSRWLISFENKPEVKVGIASNDWETQVARGGSCADPTLQPPDYEGFSTDWISQDPDNYVYRGLDVRPGFYLIDETASEFFGGVCLRGVTQIRNTDYSQATVSYYSSFGSEVENPQAHKENPTALISPDERGKFTNLVRSVQAIQ